MRTTSSGLPSAIFLPDTSTARRCEKLMTAVMSFSQRLAVLVSGKKVADGKPEEVVRDPEVVRAYLGE